MNAEAEAFLEAVRALDLLQDQLDWADVKSSWKSAAARWAKQLRKCRYPADLDLLWKLAGELMKDIKPTNFIVGWLINADGSESTRYRQWLTETDARSACAILKAVRVLRAHLVRVMGGPLFALDGTCTGAREERDRPAPSTSDLARLALSRRADRVVLPVRWPWTPSLSDCSALPSFDGLSAPRIHRTSLVFLSSRCLDDYHSQAEAERSPRVRNAELHDVTVTYTHGIRTTMGFHCRQPAHPCRTL